MQVFHTKRQVVNPEYLLYLYSMLKFRIKYLLQFEGGEREEHVITIKNCYTKVHAMTRLETYLKKKHGDKFHYMAVLSCEVDNPFLNMFDFLGVDVT